MGQRVSIKQQTKIAEYSAELAKGVQQNDREAVEATVRRLLASFPESADAHYLAISAYAYLGFHVESVAEIAVVLALNPKFYPAHIRLAMVLVQQGQASAASHVLEIGWRHAKNDVSSEKYEEERKAFFSVLSKSVDKPTDSDGK